MPRQPDEHSRHGNGRMGHHSGKPSGPDEIRSRMAHVREELQRDVAELTHDVQQATDWKMYVRKFPFACVGVAALIGFSLVPSRRRATMVATDEQIKKLADAGKLHVIADPPPAQKAGVTKKIALALGTVAARAAMAYVGKELGQKANNDSSHG
jgi:hypothetical protein